MCIHQFLIIENHQKANMRQVQLIYKPKMEHLMFKIPLTNTMRSKYYKLRKLNFEKNYVKIIMRSTRQIILAKVANLEATVGVRSVLRRMHQNTI